MNPILCESMDYSSPGSSVHGMLQARILEWVAIPFSRGSSQLRDRIQVSIIAGRFFRETQWECNSPGCIWVGACFWMTCYYNWLYWCKLKTLECSDIFLYIGLKKIAFLLNQKSINNKCRSSCLVTDVSETMTGYTNSYYNDKAVSIVTL